MRKTASSFSSFLPPLIAPHSAEPWAKKQVEEIVKTINTKSLDTMKAELEPLRETLRVKEKVVIKMEESE